MNVKNDFEVVLVGLGYVGLPLAMHLAKNEFKVIGFDISSKKIKDLSNNIDDADILSHEEKQYLPLVSFSSVLNQYSSKKKIYIVTVPTPVSDDKVPDFKPLINASASIGQVIKQGDIVVFESTVYPGATEEICVPQIEKTSNLKFGHDFQIGYSPERVNPGDRARTLDKIIKVVAGSDKETQQILNTLYGSIVSAGIHQAQSIAVAEASKVVENIQRDVNIALMNELQRIFDKLDININDVLDASSTKWNFMNVRPGLVGGHCIGVDPYYLIHKAKAIGQNPVIIESARLVNENHVEYSISKLLKYALKNKIDLTSANILVYGLSFKPDCEDLRNSKAFSVLSYLNELQLAVTSFDPYHDKVESHQQEFDLVIVVTKHSSFEADIKTLVSNTYPTKIYELI